MYWNVFQDFNINFLKFLPFFQVFYNLFDFFYYFFRHQGPRDLLQGLMISCRIVSRVNEMVINYSSILVILITPVLAIF